MKKREKIVRGALAGHWIPAIGRKQEKPPKNIENSPKRGLKAEKQSPNGQKWQLWKKTSPGGLAVMAEGSAVVVTWMPDDRGGGTE